MQIVLLGEWVGRVPVIQNVMQNKPEQGRAVMQYSYMHHLPRLN